MSKKYVRGKYIWWGDILCWTICIVGKMLDKLQSTNYTSSVLEKKKKDEACNEWYQMYSPWAISCPWHHVIWTEELTGQENLGVGSTPKSGVQTPTGDACQW